MELIDYDDKVALYSNPDIPDVNKVKDTDMNKIKSVVNGAIQGTNPMGNVVVDSIRSKNIIPSETGSQSINGLTITRYNDGSFKIHGTTTASISKLWIFQGKNIVVKAGTYTLSTHSTGTVNDTVYFVLRNSLDQEMPLTIDVKSANSRTNTLNDDVAIMNGYLYIGNNITFDNFVIYPQLEEGNSVSNYATYQNLDGYDNYSTGEEKIGTWIDGKSLYRKVVNIGTLPNNTSGGGPHGISNINLIVKIYGYCTNGSAFRPLPCSSTNTSIGIIDVFADPTYIYVRTNANMSSYSGFVVLEYTKTTD